MEYITIKKDKNGEMDFGINCLISELSRKDFNKLRIITIVAIGKAEDMYRKNNELVCCKELKK